MNDLECDNSFETISDISSYQIYLSDIYSIDCLNESTNLELLKKLNLIILDLEKLFKELGYDNFSRIDGKVLWISDKVEYCLQRCTDLEMKKQLNELFFKYCSCRDKIVSGNLRLVISIAKRYDRYRDNVSFDDIIQYGNIGLMKAVDMYDISSASSFSCYASKWITHYIKRNILNADHSVKIPEHLIYENYNRLIAMSDLSMELCRNISDKEAEKYLGVPSERLASVMMYFAPLISLDEVVDTGYIDEEATLGGFVLDDSVNVYQSAIVDEYNKYLVEVLATYLTKRELDVLRLSIGLDGINYSFVEIASILGVSQQRVSQLNKNAIKKLKRIPNIREIVMG